MGKGTTPTEEKIIDVEISYGVDMNVFPVGKSLYLDDVLDCDDASEFFSNKGEFTRKNASRSISLIKICQCSFSN